MPRFSSTAALEVYREIGPDIPFIIVSGTMGDEEAVAAMRNGAHDYILKGNLTRLSTAVTRELAEAEVRRKRKRAKGALRESEKRFRSSARWSPRSHSVSRCRAMGKCARHSLALSRRRV